MPPGARRTRHLSGRRKGTPAARGVGTALAAAVLLHASPGGAAAEPFAAARDADGAGATALLPATDAEVRLGDDSVSGGTPQGAPQRGIVVTPRLDVDEIITDNVYALARPREPDFVTTISPGITVSAATPRLQGQIDYAPRAMIYGLHSREDTVDHELRAGALATLVPDAAFLDLRGYATQQSTLGGYAPSGVDTLPQGQRTQTVSLAVSPYLLHRFGDAGTLEGGYAFRYTNFSNLSPSPGIAGGSAGLVTNEERVSFRSGSILGRLSGSLLLDAVQESGRGTARDAARDTALGEIDYALTRTVVLLGQGGYERLRYDGFPPFRYTGPIWSVGVRYTPDPDSTVTLRYGRRDGFDALFLDAATALTAHVRVTARYTTGVETGLEEVQDNLAAASFDVLGAPVDARTGAPVLLADQLLGVQDSLARVRSASAGVILTWPRDTVTLSVLHDSRELLSSGVAGTGYSDTGTSGSVAWSHELTPVWRSNVYAQYGGRSISGLGDGSETVLSLGASTAYQFSETLTGVAQVSHITRTSSLALRGLDQNAVLLGLHKRF